MLVCGCSVSGSKTSKELDKAQSLLEDNPGEAFQILNAIDISCYDDSATMARWALLYSEAMAANKLNAPTDTIINIALDYYEKHLDKEALQRAETLKRSISFTGQRDRGDSLATALYIQKEKEFYLFKERTRKEQYALIGIIAIGMATGIIIRQRQRIRLEMAQTNALIAEASAMKSALENNRTSVLHMKDTLYGVLQNRFTLIDGLCQTYYESQGTKVERKAITEKVKTEIELLKNDAGMFAEIENSVNSCRNNILKRLKEAFPDIKPEDYRLAAYLACGMSNRTISLLLGKTMDVVYKRKSRIKSRIKERNLPDNDDFIGIFR